MNPIELAFSSMKAICRRNSTLFSTSWGSEGRTCTLLTALAFTAGPEKAKEWFRHCGYVA
jgi:hypothetical protein